MKMEKIRLLYSDKKGTSYILVCLFLFFIICIMLVVSEAIRVHDLREHIYDEMYRAANLAIKTAMYDSYRIDSVSKFNEETAVNYFKDYLKDDLELNSAYEKLDENGEVAYRLVISEINVDGDNVRMEVKLTAYAKPMFNMWDAKWEIPIDVISRNMRTD